MRRNIIAGLSLVASLIGASAASAQVIYVDQRGGEDGRGRYERGVDRDRDWDGHRDRDRRAHRRHDDGDRYGFDGGRRRGWDEDRVLVRRDFRDHDRFDRGCRDITVRKHDRWGNPVVKHIHKCG